MVKLREKTTGMDVGENPEKMGEENDRHLDQLASERSESCQIYE